MEEKVTETATQSDSTSEKNAESQEIFQNSESKVLELSLKIQNESANEEIVKDGAEGEDKDKDTCLKIEKESDLKNSNNGVSCGNDENAEGTSDLSAVTECDSLFKSEEVNAAEEQPQKNVSDSCVNAAEEQPQKNVDDSCVNAAEEQPQKNVNDSPENVAQSQETMNGDGSQTKNYKDVILQDWDVDTPQSSENLSNNNKDESEVLENHAESEGALKDGEVKEAEQAPDCMVEEREEVVKVEDKCDDQKLNNNDNTEKLSDSQELLKPVLDKKKNPLKYSNLIVSNQDIVNILDNSVERVCRPIIPAKDIFLSIELTKQLNRKLNSGGGGGTEKKSDGLDGKNPRSESSKILPDYRTKLTKTVDDLKSKDNEVSQKDGDNASNVKKEEQNAGNDSKKGKRKSMKKNLNLNDEMERTLALRQLRDEFPTPRKKSHTKKINHIPFLASSYLEKALTSSVNTPSKAQRRRPCYLPDNETPGEEESFPKREKVKENNEIDPENSNGESKTESNDKKLGMSDLSNSSTPIVRTYSIKRKSTDSDSEALSGLQTFISARKEQKKENESKPKKQKTVEQGEAQKDVKTIPKKNKVDGSKKRNLELEKLLGDEGAIRMLYETQHKDDNNRLSGRKSRTKTTLGLKNDLMLKTKLVKNAVLRLSGASSDGISLRAKRGSGSRGERRSGKSETEPGPESLFVTSTPNVILYKPRKKQRAEASKILYRHSSSESFESVENFRRASVEGFNSTNNEESGLVNGDLFKKTPEGEDGDFAGFSSSQVAKKTKLFAGKGMKKLKKKEMESKMNKERINAPKSSGPKFQWSNVPIRKSSRPRAISKKYSIWATTSMDSLSSEYHSLKKPKKAQELAKLNYKELRILQPHENLFQIVLAPSSTVLKNSFNEQVLTELHDALEFLADYESCSVILLTSTGSTFCQGIDLNYVLSVEEDDRKRSYGNLFNCLRKLIICLSTYKKIVIAGVHSVAIGLGVTLLPFCDIVLSSDIATFYTPYGKLGQSCEGCATVTFPRINKNLVTELLYKCEKLSASGAMKLGLVSQVFPEDRFEEELMLFARTIASQSAQAMQSIKLLSNKNDLEKIIDALDIESQLVLEHWSGNECINNIIKFINSGELQFRQLDVS